MTYSSQVLRSLVARHLLRKPMATLSEVASACGVSPATIARAVRSEAGSSFRDVRRDLCLARAKVLLSSDVPRSIKEVGAILGFTCVESFCHWFRRETGWSPSVYRRMVVESRLADVALRADDDGP